MLGEAPPGSPRDGERLTVLPAIVAILAAMCFAGMLICVKRGLLEGGNTFSATFLNVGVNSVSLWLVVPLLASYRDVWSVYGLYFLGVGVLVPALARWAYYIGADRIGASRSSAIGTLSPYLSVVFALMFLGERLTPGTIVGTLLIGAGILTISSRQSDEKPWRRRDMLFPLATALLFASRDNMARWGLARLGSPVVGAALAATSGFLFMLVLSGVGRLRNTPAASARGAPAPEAASPGQRLVLQIPSMYYFIVSGFFGAAAYFCMFTAFNLGTIVSVAPVLYTEPMFILLFSSLFMREVERLSARTAAGVLTVVTGSLLVMLWK